MKLPTNRSPAFWILLALGTATTCCGLPFVALAALGLSAESEAAPAPAEGGPMDEADSPAAIVVRDDAVDDFLYQSPNGMTYIAASSVSAEGVPVALVGEWRDDRRNIVLRLKDGGRYELTNSGGVLVGEKVSNAVAHGSRSAERGSWRYDGSTLSLTPEGRSLGGSNGRTRLDTEEAAADAARAWTVVGVTIAYTPEGQSAPRERPGLHVVGPSPDWYYPAGPWDLVLRSAPWSG